MFSSRQSTRCRRKWRPAVINLLRGVAFREAYASAAREKSREIGGGEVTNRRVGKGAKRRAHADFLFDVEA
jgi:hypothetical protein